MTEKIGVQAVLEDAQFNKALNSYLAGLDAMDKGADELSASAKSTSSGLDVMDKAIDETGESAIETASKIEIFEKALDQVKQLAATGLELAELGAMSERVEQRFEAFAEAAGGAEVILEAFQEGAGGTVSKMDAMSSASRLLQMGLVGDADEMARVVEMATRLGDQTMDATSRVSDFALMLANQSIPRLDNFGISSGKVRARIAELTTGVNAMSREAAFMQATMEQGTNSLEILGERVEDNAMKMERAKAQFADLRVEIGQKLAPIAGKLAEIITTLDGATISLVIALTGAVGIAAKFSGGLGGLAKNLNLTGAQMGALGLAVVALVGVYESYTRLQGEIVEGQKKVNESLSTWQERAQEMIATGSTTAEVLEMMAAASMRAKDAMDDGGVVADIFVDQVDILGKTAKEAEEFIRGLSTGTESYNANIAAYNELVEGQSQKILTATEYQALYNEALLMFDGNAAAAADSLLYLGDRAVALTDAEWRLVEVQKELEAGTGAAAHEMRRLESNIRNAEDAGWALGTSTLDLADKQRYLAQGAEGADRAMLQLAQNIGTVLTPAEAEAWQEATKLAEAEDRVAEAAAREAAALSRAADDSTAMSVATAQLTAAEQLGIITTAERISAEEALQIALGLATEAEIQARHDVLLLAQAQVLGIITAQEYAAAIRGIEEGTYELTDAVRAEISAATEQVFVKEQQIGVSGGYVNSLENERSALEKVIISHHTLAERLVNPQPNAIAQLGIENLRKAYEAGHITFADYETGLVQIQDTFELVTPESRRLADGIGMLDTAMQKGFIPAEEYDDVLQQIYERAQDGSLDIKALFAEFGVSPDLVEPGTEAVDEFGNTIGGIQTPIEQAKAKLMELPQTLGSVETAFGVAGSAMVGNMQAGFESAWPGMVSTVEDSLQGLADQMPGSEPKDTSSPLYGLTDRGAAIVDNLAAGVTDATPGLLDAVDNLFSDIAERADLFSLGSAFGALGGSAAGLMQSQVLDPLQAQMDEYDATMDATQERLDAIDEQRAAHLAELGGAAALPGLLLQQAVDPSQLTARQLFLLSAIETASTTTGILLEEQALLEEQRAEAAAEYAEQQERIIRLQEKQEQMRFLEQQFALLDMIAEHGLDAEAILGGMELGIDANLEDLLDAMTEAMSQIIEQAEEELGVESPSKVFAEIGRRTMEGLAMGIQELANLPMAQTALATQAMISAPMALMGSGASGGAVDNSRHVTIQAGGNTIANDVGLNRFSTMIRTEVERAMRGT